MTHRNRILYTIYTAAIPNDGDKAKLWNDLQPYRSMFGDSIEWTDPSTYHITLHYIGQTDLDTLRNVKHMLDEHTIARSLHTRNFTLKGLDAFTNQLNPFVIWSGLDTLSKRTLSKFQADITKRLIEAGIDYTPPEIYNPHMTLGYVKNKTHASQQLININRIFDVSISTVKLQPDLLISEIEGATSPISFHQDISTHKIKTIGL